MINTRAAVLVLASVPQLALGASPAPEPTDIEALSSRPGVEIVHAKPIGTIESTDAKVLVTVLVLRDTANPPGEVRGLKFTLENNSTLDHVYLDESQIAALQRDLAEVEAGIAELKSGDGAPYRVQGTASCWMPPRPIRILCPSYAVGPDWSGLTLGAYASSGFAFPGHRPRELGELIDRALVETTWTRRTHSVRAPRSRSRSPGSPA